MLRPSLPFLRIAATCLALLGPAAALPAAVLHRENFDNPDKADRSLKFVNWEVAAAASFDDPVTIPAGSAANRFAVVNPGAGTGEGKPGYVWMSLSAGGLRLVRGPVTKWPAPTVERLRGGAICVDAVASTGAVRAYLLVQLDNKQWYLSAKEFSVVAVGNLKSFEAAPSRDAVTHRLPFSAAGAEWQLLQATDGKPFGFDVPDHNLPDAAVITGLGVLVRNTNTGQGVTVRLDTIVLEASEAAR